MSGVRCNRKGVLASERLPVRTVVQCNTGLERKTLIHEQSLSDVKKWVWRKPSMSTSGHIRSYKSRAAGSSGGLSVWILVHCNTAFAKQCLRHWVCDSNATIKVLKVTPCQHAFDHKYCMPHCTAHDVTGCFYVELRPRPPDTTSVGHIRLQSVPQANNWLQHPLLSQLCICTSRNLSGSR
jgi:hypothetical protein